MKARARQAPPGWIGLALVLGCALAGPRPALAGCTPVEITAPAADATLADTRPLIAWRPVPGVTAYRVRVQSRVPEGAVITDLDTLATEPRFSPPQALTDHRAIVRVTVTPDCGDAAETAAPMPGHRFFIDTRLTCPAATDLQIQRDGPGARLTWTPAPGAARHEVLVFGGDDWRLHGRGETRAAAFALPDAGSRPAVAALRVHCGEGFGAFAFAAY